MTAARRFDCQPEAVTAARLFVRARLGGEPRETVQAAEIMTSELATNCVLHARTDFELAVDARDQIRVAVSDSGAGRPRVLAPTARQLTGRGLRIVEAMADAWGIEARPKGKTVWFTLPRPGR